MPTLLEAWLAEQTAERLPWRHPVTREDSVDRPTAQENPVRQWPRVIQDKCSSSGSADTARRNPARDACSGSVR